MIAAYAQLRLVPPLATDHRRPREKPALPNKLTPARVRRGFRNLRAKTGSPAGAPKTVPPRSRPAGGELDKWQAQPRENAFSICAAALRYTPSKSRSRPG